MDNRQLFLDKLILKLKSGDARSIHLDALPGRFARLDIYDLVNIEPSLHLDFLNKLLSGKPFSFQINIPSEKLKTKGTDEYKLIQAIIRRLNSLYYREMDEFAEYGTLSFGFGYPLLVKRDPSNPARILKAPLFIWHLQIERNTQKSNSWVIKRTEDHPVLFNQVLQSHIETGSGIRWEQQAEFDEDTPLDEKALQKVCKDVLAKFNVQPTEDELFVKILPGTNKQAIDNLTKDAPWIRWSGVFGLYKTQKQPIIKDLMDLAAEKPSRPEVEASSPIQEEQLTPVLLDPSQETVLHDLQEYGKVIIQGPPGTGKSQSISAIVTSALLNGHKLLIVCEKRTALEVIKKNLEEVGLGDLLVLIDDVYSDRNAIVQRIRSQIEEARQEVPYFKIHAFDFAKEKVLKNRTHLNERIEALHQRVFGDDTWLELAERHQRLLSKLTAPPLALEVDNTFPLNFEAWLRTQAQLKEDAHLMDDVREKLQCVDQLPEEYWLQQKPEVWKAKIPDLYESVTKLKRALETNYAAFGAAYYDLSKMSRITASIAGIFSTPKKALNIAREQAQIEYNSIYEQLEYLQWPDHQLPLPAIQDNMMRWPDLLQALHLKLEPVAKYASELTSIQQWLSKLKIMPSGQQQLWKSLALCKTEDRPALLEEWYYRTFLERYAGTHQMQSDAEFALEELTDFDKQIKPLLGERILDLWRNKAKNLLRSQDLTQKRMLYNLRKNKQFSSRNTLRSILRDDFEYFSTAFPVLMLNPVVASSILPLKSDLFDMIILDEASQLRVEDTYAALYRGKKHVVSGDEHQMPPSSYFSSEIILWDDSEDEESEKDLFLAESASLLEYAADAGYHPTYLDFHYRSKHPDLIAFSNAGFYGSRLIPMPPKKPYQAMFFRQLQAEYSSSTNMAEAKAIVDFLYEFAAKNIQKMPGIGVGTLNLRQRDLIQDMLWENAFADPEKNRLMEAMMGAGLFIKNLENIQGDERDIIVIGTTFGPDEKGNFRQNFGPLNRQNGYQLLNVLITRAKTELHLFCSMPENIYMNFEEELRQSGNTGKALLYAYISYVRAVSEGDNSRKEYILNVLRENKSHTPANMNHQKIVLPSFVGETIEKKVGDQLQRAYKVGGFELEAAVKSEDRLLYLQTERMAPHRNVHYRELMYRPAILKNFNIETRRIWAYQWWKNPQKELQNY